MKSCLIVEDDFSFALEVEMIIRELGFDRIDIADSIEKTKEKLALNSYSLIISDIKLGEGQYSYNYFNEANLDIPLIYTSVLQQDDIYRSVQKKKKHIYLVKPIDKITLKSAVENTLQASSNALAGMNNYIKIRSNKSIISLNPMDVLFIKSEGNYCTLHTNDKRHTVRQSLEHWKETLDSEIFVRVHRGYVVNLRKIDTAMASKSMLTIGSYEIPIGRKFKTDFILKFGN